MTYKEFRNDLKSAGLTNITFAKLVGMNHISVSNWKYSSVPSWVKPFLHYYKIANKLQKVTNS